MGVGLGLGALGPDPIPGLGAGTVVGAELGLGRLGPGSDPALGVAPGLGAGALAGAGAGTGLVGDPPVELPPASSKVPSSAIGHKER